MRIHLKNNPARFHPNPILNNRALGFYAFLKSVAPNKKNNNYKNKMSSDMRSVPDLTRQLSYRKENCAMRPIYGCPEKFPESSLRIRLLFPKFVTGFCSDRY